jgi:hypothetical protein
MAESVTGTVAVLTVATTTGAGGWPGGPPARGGCAPGG